MKNISCKARLLRKNDTGFGKNCREKKSTEPDNTSELQDLAHGEVVRNKQKLRVRSDHKNFIFDGEDERFRTWLQAQMLG